MRQIIFISILLIFNISARSQVLRGTVIDGNTFIPLSEVSVSNSATGQSFSTGSSGYFKLNAAPGDKLSFSLAGYTMVERIAGNIDTMRVEMKPITVHLPDFTLHELTQFQKDSIAMTEQYSTELNKKAIKPGFSSANGGGFTGLIGAPVQRISRGYRRNKKFKENFRRDMEQRFIDTRYKPELVTTLTGLTGDELIMFINTHPMDYDFARAASDLELKIWIRETYREYKSKQNH